MSKPLKIFSGNANLALAHKVCQQLGISLGRAIVDTFGGGETHVELNENVREADVFIIQSVCATKSASPNDALMELLILIDAARRSSSGRITAVLPYFGYARQDRKDRPHVPITAKLVCNLIVEAGAQRILTLDLHSNQIQGFADIPFDHLYAIKVFGPWLRERQIGNTTVCSPDIGGTKMARAYAELVKAPLAIIDKRRIDGESNEVLDVVGEVSGQHIIFIDDICSTGGTLAKAAAKVKSQGALSAAAICVHPVMTPKTKKRPSAIATIEESPLDWVVASDSIPLPAKEKSAKIQIVSIAPLLSEAIRRIHNDESISSLFLNTKVEG